MEDQVMSARTLLAVLAFGLLTVAVHAESVVIWSLNTRASCTSSSNK